MKQPESEVPLHSMILSDKNGRLTQVRIDLREVARAIYEDDSTLEYELSKNLQVEPYAPGMLYLQITTDLAKSIAVRREQEKDVLGTMMGPCNRGVCLKPGATWYNSSTQAFYCADCARQINEASVRSEGVVLCKDQKPGLAREKRRAEIRDMEYMPVQEALESGTRELLKTFLAVLSEWRAGCLEQPGEEEVDKMVTFFQAMAFATYRDESVGERLGEMLMLAKRWAKLEHEIG